MYIQGKKVKFTAQFYKLGRLRFRKWLDITIEGKGPRPDLTVIMMNPGSAKENETIDNESDLARGEYEVEVVGDQTLYRVAGLMGLKGAIRWIRILNLSDIREAESAKFYAFLEGAASKELLHSVFSEGRDGELRSMIGPMDRVLLAWGKSERTKNLKEMAIRRLQEIGSHILNFENGKLHYSHPLTRLEGGWKGTVADLLD